MEISRNPSFWFVTWFLVVGVSEAPAAAPVADRLLVGADELARIRARSVNPSQELVIADLAAKIDSGADSSVVHAVSLRDEPSIGGKRMVRFRMGAPMNQDTSGEVRVEILRVARVRSSNGRVEKRFVIELPICLGANVVSTEVSLTDRSRMTYPVLLGKNYLIAAKALIDVTRSRIQGRPKCW